MNVLCVIQGRFHEAAHACMRWRKREYASRPPNRFERSSRRLASSGERFQTDFPCALTEPMRRAHAHWTETRDFIHALARDFEAVIVQKMTVVEERRVVKSNARLATRRGNVRLRLAPRLRRLATDLYVPYTSFLPGHRETDALTPGTISNVASVAEASFSARGSSASAPLARASFSPGYSPNTSSCLPRRAKRFSAIDYDPLRARMMPRPRPTPSEPRTAVARSASSLVRKRCQRSS